jgi:hypothetical protein
MSKNRKRAGWYTRLGPHPLDGPYKVHGLDVNVVVPYWCWCPTDPPSDDRGEVYDKGLVFYFRSPDDRSGGWCLDSARMEDDATRADIQAMLDALPAGHCSLCGHTHLFNPGNRRGGLCHECWLVLLQARLDQEDAEEREWLPEQDAWMASRGYCYRVNVWYYDALEPDHLLGPAYRYTRRPPTGRRLKALLARLAPCTDKYTVTRLA